MYIDTMLKRFNIENSKKDYFSIGHGITLSKKDYPTTPQERECTSRIRYASIVESIMYAMMCTRSNVTYSRGIVSRYQSDLGENY